MLSSFCFSFGLGEDVRTDVKSLVSAMKPSSLNDLSNKDFSSLPSTSSSSLSLLSESSEAELRLKEGLEF